MGHFSLASNIWLAAKHFCLSVSLASLLLHNDWTLGMQIRGIVLQKRVVKLFVFLYETDMGLFPLQFLPRTGLRMAELSLSSRL